MTSTIVLVLFIIGLLLGAIDVFRSKGESLTAWGLVAVAAGLLILRIA